MLEIVLYCFNYFLIFDISIYIVDGEGVFVVLYLVYFFFIMYSVSLVFLFRIWFIISSIFFDRVVIFWVYEIYIV